MKFFGLPIKYLFFLVGKSIEDAVTEDTCLTHYAILDLRVSRLGILLKAQIKSQEKSFSGVLLQAVSLQLYQLLLWVGLRLVEPLVLSHVVMD